MKTSSTIVSAVALGAVLLSISCSSKFSDYCDKLSDCEGGNDADRSACVQTLRAAEDVADDYDCGDTFGTFFDCADSSAVCKNGKLDDSPCKDGENAYKACVKAASAKDDKAPGEG